MDLRVSMHHPSQIADATMTVADRECSIKNFVISCFLPCHFLPDLSFPTLDVPSMISYCIDYMHCSTSCMDYAFNASFKCGF